MGNAALDDLQRSLGYRFEDPGLLGRALTHASLNPGGVSNERLEFLGDRVLGLVVADMLYRGFPDENEGALARRLAALVSRPSLARVAETCRLGDHLRLADAERDAGGRANPALLANACEAVIAALYLDGGLAPAARFVTAHWATLVAEDRAPPKDPKTALQEWAQGRGWGLPVYEEIGREGPSHAPLFTVRVSVADGRAAHAEGPSKRVAERDAAARLLDRLEAR